jgi:hypothetical protein
VTEADLGGSITNVVVATGSTYSGDDVVSPPSRLSTDLRTQGSQPVTPPATPPGSASAEASLAATGADAASTALLGLLGLAALAAGAGLRWGAASRRGRKAAAR